MASLPGKLWSTLDGSPGFHSCCPKPFLLEANTARLIKYKLYCITSLPEPSSGFLSHRNQVQTCAMACETSRDQPSANILNLISLHLPLFSQLQPMGFLPVTPTGQVPFNLRTFALAISYLNSFPQMVIWLAPHDYSRLNLNITSSEYLPWSPHLKGSSSMFYSHFISFRELVTCLCISCFSCYSLSPT